MIKEKSHEQYMKIALQLAQQALEDDEVPVGAIVVCKGQIIGKGYNQVERLHDATAHAEMIAITAASEYLGAKYLKDCTLYVTLEPCIMCGGASHWAQIANIVYGASDDKMGFFSKNNNTLPSKTTITSGVLAQECGQILIDFFNQRRNS